MGAVIVSRDFYMLDRAMTTYQQHTYDEYETVLLEKERMLCCFLHPYRVLCDPVCHFREAYLMVFFAETLSTSKLT